MSGIFPFLHTNGHWYRAWTRSDGVIVLLNLVGKAGDRLRF